MIALCVRSSQETPARSSGTKCLASGNTLCGKKQISAITYYRYLVLWSAVLNIIRYEPLKHMITAMTLQRDCISLVHLFLLQSHRIKELRCFFQPGVGLHTAQQPLFWETLVISTRTSMYATHKHKHTSWAASGKQGEVPDPCFQGATITSEGVTNYTRPGKDRKQSTHPNFGAQDLYLTASADTRYTHSPAVTLQHFQTNQNCSSDQRCGYSGRRFIHFVRLCVCVFE